MFLKNAVFGISVHLTHELFPKRKQLEGEQMNNFIKSLLFVVVVIISCGLLRLDLSAFDIFLLCQVAHLTFTKKGEADD